MIISYLLDRVSVSSTKAFQLIFLCFMKCRESKLDSASFVGLEASSLSIQVIGLLLPLTLVTMLWLANIAPQPVPVEFSFIYIYFLFFLLSPCYVDSQE
jgi:hypothetical protein